MFSKLWHRLRSKPLDLARYQAIAVSRRGPRVENQDNYLLIRPDGYAHYLQNQQAQQTQCAAWPSQYWRLVLADGMGGHLQGREIAEALVQQLLGVAPQQQAAVLRQAVMQLHRDLQNNFMQPEQHLSPGTTLLWADVDIYGHASLAYVGDSRLFHWQAAQQQWQQLSHDHNHAELQWRQSGELQQHDPRLGLAQAVGVGSWQYTDAYSYPQFVQQLQLALVEDLPVYAQQHADVWCCQLQDGDALLLASDGLWASKPVLDLPDIDVLGSQQGLSGFVQQVLAAGGRDNVTALLLCAREEL